jgi:Zn-dependent peptidase ImmA (M78 family)
MKGKAFAVKQAKKLLSQFDFKADTYSCDKNHGCEVNVEAIASKLKIKVVRDQLSDNISGVFIKKDSNLVLGVNSNHSITRQRFTIAHEIGHYLLHSNETLHLDKDKNDSEIFFRSDVSSLNEVEANHFAAELLMPQELVQRCIDHDITSIFQLSNLFNVSEDAIKYRLINLGFL